MEEEQRTVMGYPIVVQPILLTDTAIHLTTTATTEATTLATDATTAHHHRRHSTQPYEAESEQTPTIDIGNKRSVKPMLFMLLLLPLGFGAIILSIPYSPRFEVHSVMLNPFNISSSHLTANWSITFSVTNPNLDCPVHFEGVKASIFYKEENISSTMMENFTVNQWYTKTHKRSMQANIGVSSMNIKSSIADEMAADWSNGAVNFTMKVNAIARPAYEYDDRVPIKVSCENIKVGISSNMNRGNMFGASKKCKVRFTYIKNFIITSVTVILVVLFFYVVVSILLGEGRKEKELSNRSVA